MAIVAILTLFFASVFVFWLLDKTFSQKKIISLRPKFKLNYSFQRWEFLDYIAFIVTTSTATLIVFALLTMIGFTFSKIVPQTLFILVSGSTLAFAFFHYRLHKFYSAHATVCNFILALATIFITLIANSIADSFITEFTHVEAGQFSSAQKTFTILGIIGIWLYIGMYLSIPIYILVTLNMLYNIISTERKQPAYVNSYTITKKPKKQVFNRSFILILGISYTVIIYLGVIGSIASSAENRLKKILVFSSFHLSPEACSIVTYIPLTKIALISDKKTVIATPDRELGYTFKTEDCKIQQPITERKPALAIHHLKNSHRSFSAFRYISPTSCPIRYCSAFNNGLCI
ncbi:hypothetical protein [Pseudomonas koreensis]|uniref:Uncharacterized protein n=1 Tax=Pseudomonas koreensis TaxID=198620 RepID=A0AA94JFR1_9PSED|nr:hypothetical protein [Pseudomonas koreensis]RVD75452.1 hypothetical protein A9HBioS_4572 [Pseudomonas koreensis]